MASSDVDYASTTATAEYEPEIEEEDEPEGVPEWVQLRAHPNYEIQTQYPFMVRRRRDGRVMALSRHGEGYLVVQIDGSSALHHRVIAEQFLANPDNSPEIDHINHQRDDNHLDNLRWVCHRKNQQNRTSYNGRPAEYLDELPEGAVPLTQVRGRPIPAGYYRHGNEVFIEAGGKYRRRNPTRHHANGWTISIRTPTGSVAITWTD
jgi:hypothetical protein